MTKSEKIAQINAKLTADIAEVKAQKEQTMADYYAKVAALQREACEAKNAATDDDDEPQDCDQPTQWLNGDQWTASVVAQRILCELPTIPYNCSVSIAINHYTKDMISLQVNSYNPNRKGNAFEEILMNGCESKEQQVETVNGWFKKTEELFAFKPDNGRVAEPIARALDAIWGGGDPVSELNDIVDGVARKEEDNEQQQSN